MGEVALSEEQRQAVGAIEAFIAKPRASTFTLHGLAGTGKTTVLSHIARAHPNAILCTLTGKAASILRRKAQLPAETIHSAFYRLREKTRDKKGKMVMTWDRQHDTGDLANGLVLLDECSMVPESIAADILSTGAKIVACGDPGQLPPVKGAQYFSAPDFTLRTIHRQALESPIVRQAHRVREGNRYEADGEAFRVVAPRGIAAEEVLAADAILCWTNRTRQTVNQRAREMRGINLFPMPQRSEPVICLKNVRDLGIFNGAVYALTRPFIEGDTEIWLDVDGAEVRVPNSAFAGFKFCGQGEPTGYFDFGYAMTVHKAQGSEWSKVILIDEYRRPEQRTEWLYTAITRAADAITVIAV